MTIRDIELNRRIPRPETIRRIADALTCEPNEFMVIDDGEANRTAV